MNIDDRLRAASKALKDNSVTQIDAASRLRELTGPTHQLVADEPTVAVIPDRAPEPSGRSPLPVPPPATQLSLKPARPERAERPPLPAAGRTSQPRLKPQRLAIAVNLLLVLVVGALVALGARYGREGATSSTPPVSTVVITKTTVVVPPACLQAARQADEVIDLLFRNVRDSRLALALKAYTTASQQCRSAS